MRLKDKIALITGAAQGIGKATAQLFVQEGATVILCDIQVDKIKKLSLELGPQATYFPLDVTEPLEWSKVHDFVDHTFGRLDVLFNNAGILGGEVQDPENCTLSHWDYVHRVNLDSMFIGFKTLLPLLKKSVGASVINMSSRSGKVGVPQNAAYASSKAAIINFSKSIAMFCAQKKYPIRCNTVLPATIDTPLWDALFADAKSLEKAKEKLAKDIPLGRMGEPIDVAYSVVYLASDESKYLTGSEVVIDGGILAGTAAAPEKPETAR